MFTSDHWLYHYFYVHRNDEANDDDPSISDESSTSDESEAGAQDFSAGTDDPNASVESNIKLLVNKAD